MMKSTTSTHGASIRDDELISVHEAAERLQCAVPTLLLLFQHHPELTEMAVRRPDSDEHVRIDWPALETWLREENPRWREEMDAG